MELKGLRVEREHLNPVVEEEVHCFAVQFDNQTLDKVDIVVD